MARQLSLVCVLVVALYALTPVTGRSIDVAEQKSYYTPHPSHPTPSYGSTPTYHHSHPTPSGGYYQPPTYSTPVTPPSTPSHSYPTGSCSYWISHPDIIEKICGYWGSIEHIFGAGCAAIFGKDLSVHEALSNKRDDGYGALVREGCASWLNSKASTDFPYNAEQVKVAFTAALPSDGAAAAQAALFQQANEGMF